MSLPDEDTSVMDRLGESQFEDLSLKSSFQEIFRPETQNVIELHFALLKHTDTDESTQKCITYTNLKLPLVLKNRSHITLQNI